MSDVSTLSFIPYDNGFTIGQQSDSDTSADTLPEEKDVRSGISYGENQTGNLILPESSTVAQGTKYGAEGTEYTGTLSLTRETPSTPSVTFGAINDNGLAEFIISNSENDATNYLLISSANNHEWSEASSITGDGTVELELSGSNYWVQVHSVTNNGESYSAPLFFTIPTSISDNAAKLRLLLRTALLSSDGLTSILGSYNGVFYQRQPADAVRPWICFDLTEKADSTKGGKEFLLSLEIEAGESATAQLAAEYATESLKALPISDDYWSIRRITPDSSESPRPLSPGVFGQTLVFALHAHTSTNSVSLSDSSGNSCILPGCSRETQASIQRLQSIRLSSGGTRIVNDHNITETTFTYTVHSLTAEEHESLRNFYDSIKASASKLTLSVDSSEEKAVTFTDKPIDTINHMDGTVDVSFELWYR